MCEDKPIWDEEGLVYWNLLKNSTNTPPSVEKFLAFNSQFPSLGTLKDYQGIIISGSCSFSTYNNHKWIKELKGWIQKYYHLARNHPEETPKLVGICFGHQIISDALGGKTTKNPLTPNKLLLGVHPISPTESFWQKSYVKDAFQEKMNIIKEFNVIEYHGDAVVVLPESAQLLATSKYTSNEIYSIGDHILGFQCHPDLTPSILTDILLPATPNLDADEVQRILQSVKVDLHTHYLVKVIHHFFQTKRFQLRHRTNSGAAS